jgi:hypothetical protein
MKARIIILSATFAILASALSPVALAGSRHWR